MNNILRKLFLAKEIVSKQNELHFRRWRLIETPIASLYLHQIFRSDEDLHCHSHPWNFISLILSGGYSESTPDSLGWVTFLPGDFVKHKAEDFHKIELIKPTTTLVFTFGRRKKWGYSVDERFVGHKEYRRLKRQGKL